MEEVASWTDGYSGSDLKNLCIAAAYFPIRQEWAASRLYTWLFLLIVKRGGQGSGRRCSFIHVALKWRQGMSAGPT